MRATEHMSFALDLVDIFLLPRTCVLSFFPLLFFFLLISFSIPHRSAYTFLPLSLSLLIPRSALLFFTSYSSLHILHFILHFLFFLLLKTTSTPPTLDVCARYVILCPMAQSPRSFFFSFLFSHWALNRGLTLQTNNSDNKKKKLAHLE